jgi:hypothetical protein
MIAPTVRHATRNNSHVADFEVRTANHAAIASKSRVWPTPCRAHGTATTVGPCLRQLTRGASASMNTFVVPASNARHRRRPSPRS